MNKDRLAAFTDAILAIIMTILVQHRNALFCIPLSLGNRLCRQEFHESFCQRGLLWHLSSWLACFLPWWNIRIKRKRKGLAVRGNDAQNARETDFFFGNQITSTEDLLSMVC